MKLRKKFFKIFIFINFIICLIYIIIYISVSKYNIYVNNKKIDYYFNNEGNKIIVNNPYNMILEIPKLNLKYGIYDINDYKNNIEQNVTILNYNYDKYFLKDVVIAAHSGNNHNSFFNTLYKLNFNDEIIIYYKNKIFNYFVKNINVYKKTDYLLYEKNLKNLILVTCYSNDEYLIIEAE